MTSKMPVSGGEVARLAGGVGALLLGMMPLSCAGAALLTPPPASDSPPSAVPCPDLAPSRRAAEALAEEGWLARATTALERVGKACPAQEHLTLAPRVGWLVSLGRLQEARALASDALASPSQETRAAVGRLLETTAQQERARVDVDAAVALAARARQLSGEGASGGQLAEARRLLEASRDLRGRDGAALEAAGHLAVRQGDVRAARRLFARALVDHEATTGATASAFATGSDVRNTRAVAWSSDQRRMAFLQGDRIAVVEGPAFDAITVLTIPEAVTRGASGTPTLRFEDDALFFETVRGRHAWNLRKGTFWGSDPSLTPTPPSPPPVPDVREHRGALWLWDERRDHPIRALEGTTDLARGRLDAQLGPGGQRVILRRGDHAVDVHTVATGKRVGTLSLPEERIQAFWLSPREDVVALTTAGGRVLIWSPGGGPATPIAVLANHVPTRTATLHWPGRPLVGAVHQDDRLRVWDAATGRLFFSLPVAGGLPTEFEPSPSGHHVLLTIAGRRVLVDEQGRHADVAPSAGFSADGRLVAFHPVATGASPLVLPPALGLEAFSFPAAEPPRWPALCEGGRLAWHDGKVWEPGQSQPMLALPQAIAVRFREGCARFLWVAREAARDEATAADARFSVNSTTLGGAPASGAGVEKLSLPVRPFLSPEGRFLAHADRRGTQAVVIDTASWQEVARVEIGGLGDGIRGFGDEDTLLVGKARVAWKSGQVIRSGADEVTPSDFDDAIRVTLAGAPLPRWTSWAIRGTSSGYSFNQRGEVAITGEHTRELLRCKIGPVISAFQVCEERLLIAEQQEVNVAFPEIKNRESSTAVVNALPGWIHPHQRADDALDPAGEGPFPAASDLHEGQRATPQFIVIDPFSGRGQTGSLLRHASPEPRALMP